jgi:hypothetical protein
MSPVTDDIAPGYSDLIKTPMDFKTINRKLEAMAYATPDAFKDDLNLIWRNAKAYNNASHLASKNADRLQKLMYEWLESFHLLGSDTKLGRGVDSGAAQKAKDLATAADKSKDKNEASGRSADTADELPSQEAGVVAESPLVDSWYAHVSTNHL